jgi:hypothetical protein
MDMIKELHKTIGALDECYEQWLQRTKDDFDRVNVSIKDLEEPYKTEAMWEYIRDLQAFILDGGKCMILDQKHLLYQTTTRDYTIESLRCRSEHDYVKAVKCLVKEDILHKEYEEFLRKEGLQ